VLAPQRVAWRCRTCCFGCKARMSDDRTVARVGLAQTDTKSQKLGPAQDRHERQPHKVWTKGLFSDSIIFIFACFSCPIRRRCNRCESGVCVRVPFKAPSNFPKFHPSHYGCGSSTNDH